MRVRIHGEYGSAEFMAEYQAAVSGEPDNATEDAVIPQSKTTREFRL
jgi:hypothetical protein